MGVPSPGLSTRDDTGLRGALVPALVGFLWARVCVAAGFVVAHLLSGHVGMPYGRAPLEDGLLSWDGAFYRVIAEGWYGGSPEEAARFFPLYPGAGRVLAPLVGGREDVALLLIANLCALAGAVLLWRLVAAVLEDRGTADRTAWMVAVVPSAFVLAFAYAEGPGLLLVTATLLLVHRRRWGWAAATALAAAALRPVGVLLVVPVVVEVVLHLRRPPGDVPTAIRRRAGDVAGMAAAVLAPMAGLVAGMLWISSGTGDLAAAVRIQRKLRAGFRDPLTRLGEAIWDVARLDFRDVYNLAFALVLVVLVVVAVRRRQPWSWIAYSAVTLAVALAANNIDSLGRYALLAVPSVVALAQWGHTRVRQVAVAVVGSAGMVWLTASALLGRVVP